VLSEARRRGSGLLTDDKILVCWNALAIRAFAESGRYLGHAEFLATAQSAADFILNACLQDGILFRSWREGKAKVPAYLEDYAALILALLALYEANFDSRWYSTAVKLAEKMLLSSRTPAALFRYAPDQKNPHHRPKDLQDNATPPSGNAMRSWRC